MCTGVLCSGSDGSEGVQSSQSSVEEEAKQGNETHCMDTSCIVQCKMLPALQKPSMFAIILHAYTFTRIAVNS